MVGKMKIITIIYKYLIVLVFSLLFYGCASVKLEQSKKYSVAIKDTWDTKLGKKGKKWIKNNKDLSGFYPLWGGKNALKARLQLIESAEKSIDLQYFLIKDDSSSVAIIAALLQAADRGVRVRLLVDDVFTSFPDSYFFLMNKHSNIEVRLFNPISRRGIQALNFGGNFSQANRRMHNKSFIVDNTISIVGGRNIADEYFRLKDNSVFWDFDIVSIGLISKEISKSFDEYWNHSLAVPIDKLVKFTDDKTIKGFQSNIRKKHNTAFHQIFKIGDSSNFIESDFNFTPATANFFSDSPNKLLDEFDKTSNSLSGELINKILTAKKEVIFVSPYYIPGDEGINLINRLSNRGIKVSVITNSLLSNNHLAAHSAYAGYRNSIIEAGANLYEVKSNIDNQVEKKITLHSKIIIIDREIVFLGSPNYDPRSFEINTEMGIFIYSSKIAGLFTKNLDKKLLKYTYQIKKNDDSNLEWHTEESGQKIVTTKEPLINWWLNLKVWFMKIVPESQL